MLAGKCIVSDPSKALTSNVREGRSGILMPRLQSAFHSQPEIAKL